MSERKNGDNDWFGYYEEEQQVNNNVTDDSCAAISFSQNLISAHLMDIHHSLKQKRITACEAHHNEQAKGDR
jgi:hypothetical protein